MDVQRLIERIDEIAPPQLADEGDNIGLQVGCRRNRVTHVLVAVDVTPNVVAQAAETGAELVVSHHPLIYSPIRSLERADARTESIARLIREDISVYVAHTNYDCAPGGTNDVLADVLELRGTDILAIRKTDRFLKLVVFVPPEAVEPVRGALPTTGAGCVGNYSDCTFRAPGIGTFKPLKGADPYTGTVGKLEEVEEYRLETILPESLLSRAIDAMLAAHPYEEVAYDIYRLENRPIGYGFGRVGELARTTTLGSYARLVQERLKVQGLRVVGDSGRRVKRVAVCAGKGDSFLHQAIAAGADVFVTGTADYHRLREAEALGLALIDAGHLETERPGMIKLAERLQREFAEHRVEVSYVEP